MVRTGGAFGGCWEKVLSWWPLLLGPAAIGIAMLLNTFHWEFSFYTLGVIILVWLVAWRKFIAEPLKDRRHTVWLVAAVVAYFFALLADRRVFKFIPDEARIHSQIEECAETMGHLVMIVTSPVGTWRRYEWPARGPTDNDKGYRRCR